MISGDDSNFLVTVILGLSLFFTTAAVLYWAATIDNNIENNPGN